MAVTSREQKAQVLTRLLRLKDHSPFILICDSLFQSGQRVLDEFIHFKPADVELVRVCLEGQTIHQALDKIKTDSRKLVLVDDLGAIDNLGFVLQQMMSRGVCVVGVYHDLPEPVSYAPKGLPLVEYMATSVLKLHPLQGDPPHEERFDFEGFNKPVFEVQCVHRRKSGRTLRATFILDTIKHTNEFKSQVQVTEEAELEGLTTFNLSLTERQKKEREQVELPYYSAQEIGQGGGEGGAIVYQFEKEDDYDEEDPYEDPF